MRQQRIDKLRARCERLLVGGEAIQLEGEAVCIVYGVGLPRLGFGRSFLTNQRVIWIRRTVFPFLDRLLFWLPVQIELPIANLNSVELMKGGWGSPAFLVIEFGEDRHFFQLGKGPYPFIRNNPSTTKEWFRTIEEIRATAS